MRLSRLLLLDILVEILRKMKKNLVILIAVVLTAVYAQAQVEPEAGKWKTWFISSGKDYRLGAPGSYKNEIAEVLSR